jgi:hypothetical protein
MAILPESIYEPEDDRPQRERDLDDYHASWCIRRAILQHLDRLLRVNGGLEHPSVDAEDRP